jgi:hypothetical protein
MGCRILEARDDSGNEYAVLYDSVTMTAFGPLIHETAEMASLDAATAFLAWCPEDPRGLNGAELEELLHQWLGDPVKSASNWRRP